MKKIHHIKLIVMTALIASAIPSTLTAGTLAQQADEMFRDLGALSNTTAPQAFKGQTMNTYTGGSLFVRVPQKNYQIASLTFPSASAGCGGINLHGGSFSHISEAAFKDSLKSITTAIPGLIFQLAIDSVEPMLGANMKTFQTWAADMNKLNINSCESAKWLVGSAASQLAQGTKMGCRGEAMKQGLDANEARAKCDKADGLSAVLGDGRASKDQVPFVGNLVWASLKQYPALDQSDRELIIAMTGTTIFSAATTDAMPEPRVIAPTITSIKDLLYGNESRDASSGTGEIMVANYVCSDADCLNPAYVATRQQSLVAKVDAIMNSLADKIRGGTTAPTAAEISFVNSVSLPVYQLISVSNASANAAVSSAQYTQYKELIAVEFAHTLLSRIARSALNTTDAMRYRLTTSQLGYLQQHQANAQRLIVALDAERAEASRRAQGIVNIAQNLEAIQRRMNEAMGPQLEGLMRFAASTR